MMIKKIYLDMDGVLADFEEKFREYYGGDSLQKRNRKEWSNDWADFILNKKGFEKLDLFPGANELVNFIRRYPIDVEILSSSGGEKFHGEVTAQKINWLKNHGFDYKANIVAGRRHKKDYANDAVILIDDTEDVIRSFNSAGGHGILHKDVGITIEKLKDLLAK